MNIKSVNTQLKNGLKSVLSIDKRNIVFLSHCIETRLAYGDLPNALMSSYNVIMIGAERIDDAFEKMGHSFVHIPCKIELQGELHYTSVNVEGIDLIITADSLPDQEGRVDKEFLSKDAKRIYLSASIFATEITKGAFDVITIPSKSAMSYYSDYKDYSQLCEAGSLQLDKIIKDLDTQKIENILTYAPTQRPTSSAPLNMNFMAGYENMVIEYLLAQTDMVISYRLHASHLIRQPHYYQQLKQQWRAEERVVFDESISDAYYTTSKVLLSDFSQTAYLYSLATLKNAIFFIHNNRDYDTFIKQALSHNIVAIAHTAQQLIDKVQAPCRKDELIQIRENEVYHVGDSQTYIMNMIDSILK